MKNNICFVAGHSGGHIIPTIILAKKNLENKIFFFTTNNQADKNILNNYKEILTQKINLPIKNIPKNKLNYPQFILSFIYNFFKSFFYLIRIKPIKIISTGGLVSVPVCLAAKFLLIPIDLYELNVEPGKTVNFLAKFCNPTIYICFASTQNYLPKNKCIIAPYPIRFDPKIKNITQQEALTKINLSPSRKTILILGGSQGSLFINNLIKDFVNKLNKTDLLLNKSMLPGSVRPERTLSEPWRVEERVEGYKRINSNFTVNNINIIHQTGDIDFDWQNFYKQKSIPAITFNFNNEMENYYLASDLIICRSGAGTLAEILFFGKKCITIPLETKTTSHQLLNAQALEKDHPDLFKVIRQKDIEKNPDIIFYEIKTII